MDTEPIPPPRVDPDAARRASIPSLLVFLNNHDASCPECGYSLRGIGSANCPECGWIISLRPSDGVDRAYVLRAARWIVLIGLLLPGSHLLYHVVMNLTIPGRIEIAPMYMPYYVGHLVLLVASALALIRMRRLRDAPTLVVLRTSIRLSRIILIILLVVVPMPILLALLDALRVALMR